MRAARIAFSIAAFLFAALGAVGCSDSDDTDYRQGCEDLCVHLTSCWLLEHHEPKGCVPACIEAMDAQETVSDQAWKCLYEIQHDATDDCEAQEGWIEDCNANL